MRGTIGLTTQQAGWVASHYDRAYTAAIQGGAGSAQAAALAARSADRYQTSIHRYRANTIARTETMRAASEGRVQAWGQGMTQGFIDPLWQKEWIAESDACPMCQSIDGKRIGVKDSFPVGEPPAHPNCRCDVLLVPPKAQPPQAPAAFPTDLLPFGDLFAPAPAMAPMAPTFAPPPSRLPAALPAAVVPLALPAPPPMLALPAAPTRPALPAAPSGPRYMDLTDDPNRALEYWDMGDVPSNQLALIRRAAMDYQNTTATALNRHLRDGSQVYRDEQDVMMRLDALIRRSPGLTADVTLWRGLLLNPTSELARSFREGAIIKDAGYTSTSFSRTKAQEFADSSRTRRLVGWVLQIDAPAGTKGFAMNGVVPQDATLHGWGEFEYVLPRGTSFRVVSVDREAGVVRVEVLPGGDKAAGNASRTVEAARKSNTARFVADLSDFTITEPVGTLGE